MRFGSAGNESGIGVSSWGMTDANEIISGHPLAKIIGLSFLREKHHMARKRRMRPGGLHQRQQDIASIRAKALIIPRLWTLLATDAAQAPFKICLPSGGLRIFWIA